MKKQTKGFTLVEILVWILIFSIILIWWFEALSSIWIGKVKLLEKTDIIKETYFFTEKFFEEVKAWWTIDYEEYFNRKIVWTVFSSGHFLIDTWFWNFWNWWVVWTNTYWNGFYYCKSPSGSFMWTGWCSDWSYQRYWEYTFQFIDYNSNMNWDLWDEDGDWNIRWDDDDENLWEWPSVFTWWENVKELYLISWDRKKRNYFRWTWKQDLNSPKDISNNYIYPCLSNVYWTGCIWNIEFISLEWKDWWVNHNSWVVSTWSYDWIIDTWIVDKNLTSWAEVIAWSNNINYWQPLFSENISVSDFQVYLYPEKNKYYSWKLSSINELNPYAKIKISLTPSWKKRRIMKSKIPVEEITTTINLSDYFSK